MGLDLLADIVAQPLLRPEDVTAERDVILEELAGTEDSPEDIVDELLWRALFPDHPLGWDVVGTEKTVAAMAPETVTGFFDRWYRPANLVVAAAGAVDHDAVDAARRLDEIAGCRGAGERPDRRAPLEPPRPASVQRRRTEQAHLALGWRSVGYRSADRVAFDVIEQILGGGPSSRLFQEVRERRALAYSVFASNTEFVDCGALVVYAGVAPSRARESLAVHVRHRGRPRHQRGDRRRARRGEGLPRGLDVARLGGQPQPDGPPRLVGDGGGTHPAP